MEAALYDAADQQLITIVCNFLYGLQQAVAITKQWSLQL